MRLEGSAHALTGEVAVSATHRIDMYFELQLHKQGCYQVRLELHMYLSCMTSIDPLPDPKNACSRALGVAVHQQAANMCRVA